MSSFEALGLSPALLTGIEALGYREPTPIQQDALPPALAGQDILGQAPTGSGKSGVFALASLSRIDLSHRGVQALVLSPTRELAGQLTKVIRAHAVGMNGTRVFTFTGGAPHSPQHQALRAGVHVVVGTPGRILQHLEQGKMDLGALRTLVIDEGDKMLEMGFSEQVEEIVAFAPAARQTMFFSATWPSEVVELSASMMHPDAVRIAVEAAMDSLRQTRVTCGPNERMQALCSLLAARTPTPTMVFCEMKRHCADVVETLQKEGVSAMALHGDLEQRERENVIAQFANQSTMVLVATDVAARGIDIDEVGLIVCLEPSPRPDAHLHRVGRTARANRDGEAVILVATDGDHRRIQAIEEAMGIRIPEEQPGKPGDLFRWLAPWATIKIAAGRRDKLRPGDILGALTGECGLAGEDVGKILVRESRTWVAIRSSVARQVAQRLQTTKIKKRRRRVMLLG